MQHAKRPVPVEVSTEACRADGCAEVLHVLSLISRADSAVDLVVVRHFDFSTLLSDHLNRQLRRDAGITHADYTLLSHLSAEPDGTLTMSELAERLKITRSRLTHAVTRLQEAGYVHRREDPGNRRNQLAVLAPRGRELLEQAAPGHVEAVRRAVFDALTPEQVRQFAEIGEAINAALQGMDASGGEQEALPWRRR